MEDTDRADQPLKLQANILQALAWLGLDWDEGPTETGNMRGDRGPYIQSERVAAGIYQRYVDQLIEQGDAYYCFATAEELAELRQQQEAAGEHWLRSSLS